MNSWMSRLLLACAPPLTMFIIGDRKSTRLNSSHLVISYAVFCLKKKKSSATLHALDQRDVAESDRACNSGPFFHDHRCLDALPVYRCYMLHPVLAAF